jgi:histone-binding protein RBBP4
VLSARPRHRLRSEPEKDYTEHRLLLGTHTSEAETNHLMIATVQLPRRASPRTPPKLDEDRGGVCCNAAQCPVCAHS